MKQLKEDIKEGKYWEGLTSFFQRRHLPLLGYIILVFAIAFTFWLNERDRAERRSQISAAVAVNCVRLNRLSDQRAADIYRSWADLEKNAELLGIELTPALKAQVLINNNRELRQLTFYDCSRSPFESQVVTSYQPIVPGKPLPSVPLRDNRRR